MGLAPFNAVVMLTLESSGPIEIQIVFLPIKFFSSRMLFMLFVSFKESYNDHIIRYNNLAAFQSISFNQTSKGNDTIFHGAINYLCSTNYMCNHNLAIKTAFYDLKQN